MPTKSAAKNLVEPFWCDGRDKSVRLTPVSPKIQLPGAVSHQTKNLEQELGQELFDRDGGSLTLTDAGLSLYKEVNPHIQRLDEAASRHKSTAPRGTLRISVQPFFASELFVPRLAEFTAAHPEIDIKVDTSDVSGK